MIGPTPAPEKNSLKAKTSYFAFLMGLGMLGFAGSYLLFDHYRNPLYALESNPLPSLSDLKGYLRPLTPSQRKEIDLIARTVFGEARGEKSIQALKAIAHVILNRVKDHRNWPNSVQAVILQKNQFSCWNEQDPNYYAIQSVTFNNPDFRQAYQATLLALLSDKDITHGANHYHARWVNPTWAQQKNMLRVAEIHQHIFYKA